MKYLDDNGTTLYQGHALDVLACLPEASVHCCVTSPPYWGLRDYKVDGQIGLEDTPAAYVESMVAVFSEVRRVLRPEGVLWLNLGDCYATGAGKANSPGGGPRGENWAGTPTQPNRMPIEGLKAKDLVGIPWRVAFALQADGWYLRSAIPWVKRSAMPESTRDRPATSLEHVFLLTKNRRYFYDALAVARVAAGVSGGACFGSQDKGADGKLEQSRKLASKEERAQYDQTRNWRNGDVFFESIEAPHGLITDEDGDPIGLDVNTESFPGAHFATFPRKLVEPLIRAGTSEKGVCPECGAPWVRLIDRVDTGKSQKKADGWATHEGGHGSFHRDGREAGQGGVPVTAAVTSGWEPPCECSAEPVPAVVLDPFVGSGTVCQVARKLGRHSIGIDLNEAYLAMAADRLRARSLFV